MARIQESSGRVVYTIAGGSGAGLVLGAPRFWPSPQKPSWVNRHHSSVFRAKIREYGGHSKNIVAQSAQVEQILNLATALYRRGAVPEALAIAREVFVSLLDSDDLTELLPKWIRSLKAGAVEPPSRGAGTAVGKAIDVLGPVLDPAASIRALTNLCIVRPDSGAQVAERALRGMHFYETGKRWRSFPVALRSPAIGWEIASPVLDAARRHRLVVPEDFTVQIAQRLPVRTREPLSRADIDLVNAYASGLREQGQEQSGIRLAAASAVTSIDPVPMTQVIEIIRPNLQVRDAAELFDQRGYSTEAVNVLLGSIQELPVTATEWQQLLERVEQSVPKPSASRSGPPPKPHEKPPDSEQPKSFFFLLQGDQAYKDQVVRGQPANLYFLYDVPSLEALARLESKTLDEIAKAASEGDPIEIGVFVKPVGFKFRGNTKDYQVARIEDDELKNKVCFKLQARDQPDGDTGVYAVLTYNGAEVFQAFIRIAIVDAIDKTSAAITQLTISRSTFDLNDALPRDITAFITTDYEGGECRVSVRVGSELPRSPKVLNRNTLATAILSARNAAAKVAESPAFSKMKPGRWAADPGQEPEFLGALCRMMTAGSKLHKFLQDSVATSELVEEIEALPEGSKISFFTDSAFVPWEIVFPRYFFSDAQHVTPGEEPDGFRPELLWGNRFEFETVLVFSKPSQNVQHSLPSARRQPGALNIRIGIGSTVEPDPEPGTPTEEADLNAKVRHRAYCDRNPSVAHWLEGSKELEKAFADPDYDVSLLYLMCHGKSDGTDEELDFGAYKSLPESLNPERMYPGWPIVFINSCSIAGLSPHVFDSFLRRFREKNAFGIIASSFPLPTRFATLFGCEFLDGYSKGMRVGQLFLELRQRLLKNKNPLAFFYSLQCPLDVQRPEQPKQP
jgi:hypothetical protein